MAIGHSIGTVTTVSAGIQKRWDWLWFPVGSPAGGIQQKEKLMTNPNHDPEDRELVTLRCPCDNEQPCCSQTVTSPKGFITIIFWDCQSITDEIGHSELAALRDIINAIDEVDDDEVAAT